MLRFTLREAARLVLGLAGAVLMAAMIAALSRPGARDGSGPYVLAVVSELATYMRFDLGTSAVTGSRVIADLSRTLPWTLVLATAGIAIAVLLGAPLGILFGTGRVRRAASPLIQIVAAAPVFCAGLGLAYVAHNVFHWPIAMADGSGVTLDALRADPATAQRALKVALLPALTVGLAGAASVQLMLRRAAAETDRAPYRAGLRRMGLGALEIDRVYVAPDVLAGMLDNLGELTLALFAASAVAEWVFNCPGAAVLFVKSVALADWTMAAAILLVFASIKLLADFAGHVAAHALANAGAAE
jgi:peptide/nickel transport system permease protein